MPQSLQIAALKKKKTTNLPLHNIPKCWKTKKKTLKVINLNSSNRETHFLDIPSYTKREPLLAHLKDARIFGQMP